MILHRVAVVPCWQGSVIGHNVRTTVQQERLTIVETAELGGVDPCPEDRGGCVATQRVADDGRDRDVLDLLEMVDEP